MFARTRQESRDIAKYALPSPQPVYNACITTGDILGLKWLARNGDPYDLSVTDRDGRIGIDFGVYGVPESFLIDKAGVIRYKQIGPVTNEALRDKILPLIQELQK